ncbi:nucleotide exchange factor GrpE [Apilactobacillus xinyiensis]|uniref:nucleotide exchange factor GrpE n=1 Tax=Apilactobacillus xinyiensis TaxID=2841032 RepID=UPI001C7CD67C|nr:nucleotide exchange factor GrpE [Apilactobacillus xinyiensis]
MAKDKEEKNTDQKVSSKKEQTNSESVKDNSSKKAKDKEVSPEDKKIKELETKVDELSDKYLRSEAEMQNMQTRFKREKASMLKYDGQKLASSILPVIDNLQRAVEVEVNDDGGKQLKKGVEMVISHFNKALGENDIESINPLNEKFDPNLCQAVQTETADEEHPADTVVKVLQKGYKLSDRVIRPAMVVVAQ